MILYLDTSALIKRYIDETGSEESRTWIKVSQTKATSLITRAEMAAGLTRLLRMNVLTRADYSRAIQEFRTDWIDYRRLAMTEQLVARAARLACEFGLRGYDAVHLAAALTWQENLNFTVTLATFDKELADAARQSGLTVLPE